MRFCRLGGRERRRSSTVTRTLPSASTPRGNERLDNDTKAWPLHGHVNIRIYSERSSRRSSAPSNAEPNSLWAALCWPESAVHRDDDHTVLLLELPTARAVESHQLGEPARDRRRPRRAVLQRDDDVEAATRCDETTSPREVQCGEPQSVPADAERRQRLLAGERQAPRELELVDQGGEGAALDYAGTYSRAILSEIGVPPAAEGGDRKFKGP